MKSEELLSITTPFKLVEKDIRQGIISSIGLNKDLAIPTVNMLVNARKELGTFLLDEFNTHGGIAEGLSLIHISEPTRH